MDIRRIVVELGDRSYTVFVGNELTGGLPALLGGKSWKKAAIVTDRDVGPLYLERVERPLVSAGVETGSVMVDPGENSKSINELSGLLGYFSSRGMTRGDLVIGLGGGVIGDLAGFAASVFKRGLALLHIPTTLMAQVDSSIGGKTAVNLPSGKNLVGTFYQPIAVISDVSVLASLSNREYMSGLAEVAKYMFLDTDGWTGGMEEYSLARDKGEEELLVGMVGRCAEIKAQIVARDELDTGLRAVLNYGHTLGHALETATEYTGLYTHGEAVSVGMVFAAMVSGEMNVAARDIVAAHRGILRSVGLPTAPFDPAPEFDKLYEIMAQDKKNRGSLTMVLLEEEGRPVVKSGLERDLLWKCYRELISGE